MDGWACDTICRCRESSSDEKVEYYLSYWVIRPSILIFCSLKNCAMSVRVLIFRGLSPIMH